jgi:hypothetical protein
MFDAAIKVRVDCTIEEPLRRTREHGEGHDGNCDDIGMDEVRLGIPVGKDETRYGYR